MLIYTKFYRKPNMLYTNIIPSRKSISAHCVETLPNFWGLSAYASLNQEP